MNEEQLDHYIERIEVAVQKTIQKLGNVIADQMKSEITESQFFILRLLMSKGTMTASEMAHELGVKPSAVTAMIDRLHKSELVLRQRDENDRRVVFLSISEKGHNLYQKVEQKRKKVMKHYYSHFEEAEMETLLSLYEKLANVITRVELEDEEE